MQVTKYIDNKDGSRLYVKGVPDAEVLKMDGGTGDLAMRVSSESPDHDGDVVHHGRTKKGTGWDLKHFNKKPVLAWYHDLGIPNLSGPRTKAKVEKDEALGRTLVVNPMQFDEGDMLAMDLDGKLRRGIPLEASVGFITNNYTRREAKEDEEGPRGFDIWSAQLLEVSIVNRGANPDTELLQKRLLGKGALEDVEDAGDNELLDLKEEVEYLRREIKALHEGLRALTADQEEQVQEALKEREAAKDAALDETIARLKKLGIAVSTG